MRIVSATFGRRPDRARLILLGHQSVRITEKHYAPWVRSRQDQLEADLESADEDSIRNDGARGGGRTHTSRKGQGILSPPRMPFRHPGVVDSMQLTLKRQRLQFLI